MVWILPCSCNAFSQAFTVDWVVSPYVSRNPNSYKSLWKPNSVICVNFPSLFSFKDYMLVQRECCCLWWFQEIWYSYTQSVFFKLDIPHSLFSSCQVTCWLDLSRYRARIVKLLTINKQKFSKRELATKRKVINFQRTPGPGCSKPD